MKHFYNNIRNPQHLANRFIILDVEQEKFSVQERSTIVRTHA